MEKIKREQLAMNTAILNSLRADCKRRKVGACLVKDGRVIATSYNGALPQNKGCGDSCDLSQSCKKTVHAEVNLIAFCAKMGISTEGSILYVTLSPCKECAKLIIQSGIRMVWFLEDYTDNMGEKLLRINNIPVYKYDQETEGDILLEGYKAPQGN